MTPNPILSPGTGVGEPAARHPKVSRLQRRQRSSIRAGEEGEPNYE